MKTLIIGAGEVGKALKEVISKFHGTLLRDIEPIDIGTGGIEVLQICYPDHEGFVETTNRYINQYNPALTIINSSLPIGTCDQFDEKVVYSPIRGRHNRFNIKGERTEGLESDIPKYIKFVFGSDKYRKIAASYFRECGIECYDLDCENRKSGELIKLLSNVHMGLEIAWRQECERILNNYGVSPFLYYTWESSYNQGYEKCGDPHLIRPQMKPDLIGGHCILPCTEIISKQFPSKAFDFILESNEKRKKELAQLDIIDTILK